MNAFVQDLRYALRFLRKSPAFTAVSVITLALGIGANTAIFSVIYAVLLRPLPFKDPERLVLVSEYKPGNVAKTGSPLTRYQARAAQTKVFEETGGYWDVSGGNGVVFGGNGSPERLQFSIVTNTFFAVLGVRPVLGRTFSPSEEHLGAAKVFLASNALWRRQLRGDPDAIGKSFRLDGESYTLVGVLPPDFPFPSECDIWMPLGVLGAGEAHDRVSHQFWMIGRLRRGGALSQAQAELDAIQRQLAQAYPETDANWRVRVTPLLENFVGNVRASLWILFAAVAFVLLIACVNVISLSLARGVARTREFAIRGALGAGRTRLLRLALAEALLIASGGTLLALALAAAGLHAIIALSSGTIPRVEQPQLDAHVLVFSAALAVITTLLVGIAPGLQASRISCVESLQNSQRSGFITRSGAGLRNLLVTSEVALTVLLLCGAGLMLRSFARLSNVDPGFRAQGLVSMKIALPEALYPRTDQRANFLRQLLEPLNSAPGISVAAVTDRLPLSGETNWGGFNIVGRPVLDSAHAPVVEGRAVSANYFRAVGIPLLRGREFSESEVEQGRRVVVINQAMAAKFWPGRDPIGQQITSPYQPTAPPREVIGVVGNIKDAALDADSPPEMYTLVGWWTVMNLVIRSTVDESALTATVRHAVAALDRGVPVYGVTRMDRLIGESIARQRFEMVLLGLFAVVALVLAAVGIYGLLSFAVDRQTQAIGVRMALGATATNVLSLVVTQGMKLAVAGLAAGALASLWLTQLMRSLLFHISPSDPLTFAGVTLLLLVVAAAASYIPARRAARVDPVVALRYE